MRIESGDATRYLYFVAVDATDLVSRETGLTSFTAVRSRNGAADVTYTTPTVAEIDATTMPGVYALLVDEDNTISSGVAEEEVALHITHAGMNPVTTSYTLFQNFGISLYKTAQAGAAAAITLASSDSSTDDTYQGDTIEIVAGTGIGQSRQITAYVGSSRVATVDRDWATAPDSTSVYRRYYGSLAASVTEIQDGLALASVLGTPAGASVVADVAAVQSTADSIETKVDTVDTVADAVKTKTDSLTFTTAGIVDANVQQINDVTITGDGSTTPYGV